MMSVNESGLQRKAVSPQSGQEGFLPSAPTPKTRWDSPTQRAKWKSVQHGSLNPYYGDAWWRISGDVYIKVQRCAGCRVFMDCCYMSIWPSSFQYIIFVPYIQCQSPSWSVLKQSYSSVLRQYTLGWVFIQNLSLFKCVTCHKNKYFNTNINLLGWIEYLINIFNFFG